MTGIEREKFKASSLSHLHTVDQFLCERSDTVQILVWDSCEGDGVYPLKSFVGKVQQS